MGGQRGPPRFLWVVTLCLWPSGTECTKPSHSQSLANFVANFHSQGISAARTKCSQFHSQNHSHSLAQTGARQNAHRIRSRIAAAAVHSAWELLDESCGLQLGHRAEGVRGVLPLASHQGQKRRHKETV